MLGQQNVCVCLCVCVQVEVSFMSSAKDIRILVRDPVQPFVVRTLFLTSSSGHAKCFPFLFWENFTGMHMTWIAAWCQSQLWLLLTLCIRGDQFQCDTIDELVIVFHFQVTTHALPVSSTSCDPSVTTSSRSTCRRPWSSCCPGFPSGWAGKRCPPG